MICGGDANDIYGGENANTVLQQFEPQGLNCKNYVKCLRSLRDKFKTDLEQETLRFKQDYEYLSNRNPNNPNETKAAQDQAKRNIKLRMEKVQELEGRCSSLQSMVNFLKQNPHKFNKGICDAFLEKHGLTKKFQEIADVYLQDIRDKLDMTGLDSFISESNLMEISSRSILRSIDSNRRTEVRRIITLQNMLNSLEDRAIEASKRTESKKRLHKSTEKVHASRWAVWAGNRGTCSLGVKGTRKECRLKAKTKNLNPFALLFHQEMTPIRKRQPVVASSIGLSKGPSPLTNTPLGLQFGSIKPPPFKPS